MTMPLSPPVTDAGRVDGEETEQRRGSRADQDSYHDHQPERPVEAELQARGEDRRRVRAHAEVRRLAERRQPGEPEQYIQAHGEDGEDQRVRDEHDYVRARERSDDEHREQHRGHDQHIAPLTGHDHSRPKRPVGFSARIRTIGA
jgi:hypothetical protein